MRKKENGRKMKWGEWEKGRKGEKEKRRQETGRD